MAANNIYRAMQNRHPATIAGALLGVAAALVAGIMVYYLNAATPAPSAEAENGALTKGAIPLDNANASGNKSIAFTAGIPSPWPHASLPGGVRRMPTPTINLDWSGAADVAPWMQYELKPMLLAWYPVLADYFATPEYTPATTFTVKADPAYAGFAYTARDLIVFNPDKVRADPGGSVGMIIHEIAHVAQYNSSPSGKNFLPSWIVEGGADFVREHIYNDRAPRAATAAETYYNGYSPGSNLLYYVQSRYDAGFVHAVNVAGATGNYSDTIFVQKTGKTPQVLWKELTGQTISASAPFRGIAGKCVDLLNYATADGTRPHIQTCNGSQAELWYAASWGTNTVVVTVRGHGNKCLDVVGGSAAENAAVQYATCSTGTQQQWERQTSGALKNVKSGKCLATAGGSSVEMTFLVQSTCDGSLAEIWTLPPGI